MYIVKASLDERSVSSLHSSKYIVCSSDSGENPINQLRIGAVMSDYGPTTAFSIDDEEQVSFVSQSSNNQNGEHQRDDVEPILVATAVPHSIRPPQKNLKDEANPSFLKRCSILLLGLYLAVLTFFDSFYFIEFNFGSNIMILAGLMWLSSCVLLLLGSVVGFINGRWRMLVPGIIVSHVASFLIRLM